MAGRNHTLKFVIGDKALRLLIEGHLVVLTDPVSGESIEVVLSRELSRAAILDVWVEAIVKFVPQDEIRKWWHKLDSSAQRVLSDKLAATITPGQSKEPPDPPQAREFLPNRRRR